MVTSELVRNHQNQYHAAKSNINFVLSKHTLMFMLYIQHKKLFHGIHFRLLLGTTFVVFIKMANNPEWWAEFR